MKHIFLFFLLISLVFNNSYLFGKILPPTPAELEKKKELEQIKKKPVVAPKTSKSVQDTLPSRSVEKEQGINVGRDAPQKNKGSKYDNTKDLSDVDINSRSKTDITSTTTDFVDDGYELPKVDSEYLNKTKNRASVSKSFNAEPLIETDQSSQKYFSESDMENYNDLANPYSFKLSSYPAIVRLRNNSKEDSNIEAILYSNAPRSKIFEFKLVGDSNIASYSLLNHLAYRAPNTIFAVDYDKQYEVIAVKTKSLHYMFIPNNAMISILKATVGVIEVRKVNLYAYMPTFKNSEYAYYYLISRLASGQIDFSAVGGSYPREDLIIDNYQEPQIKDNVLTASLIFIDGQESIITNAPKKLFNQLDLLIGDDVSVIIYKDNQVLYQEKLKYQEDQNTLDLQSAIGFSKINLMYLHLKNGVSLKSKAIKYGQGYTLKIIKTNK